MSCMQHADSDNSGVNNGVEGNSSPCWMGKSVTESRGRDTWHPETPWSGSIDEQFGIGQVRESDNGPPRPLKAGCVKSCRAPDLSLLACHLGITTIGPRACARQGQVTLRHASFHQQKTRRPARGHEREGLKAEGRRVPGKRHEVLVRVATTH